MVSLSKKSLAIINNEINKQIFNIGVQDQKIDILDNKILIIARTKRIPALSILEEDYHPLVSSVDSALSVKYKQLLKEKIEKAFDLKITYLFRDYDPLVERTCIVLCFG
ncbi:Na-translocating system protein MpsC family protein [Terrilactibacillus laevilacticus]|uniref:Na-translocating system protein MpsC family protein n=1 Tax=Terrilactibacillus laevilacticus TaxID=1380157 RepID=A0ABW5PPC1_9BACI|nr:Na-translocating system protein MpsC family protein [Terrilactibacillus laevilacticus]